jgi:sugar phosphate isomerase/epimerase
MTPPFEGLALHTWSIDTTPIVEALRAARDGGFGAVELRRVDFVRSFERGMTNDQVLQAVRDSRMHVCTLGVEYGWLFATGDDSKRLYGVFRESCANAVAIGCKQLMSAPGPFVGTIKDAIPHLKNAAEIAGEFGLDLAIEFNSQHDVLNHVDVLAELIDGASAKNAGMLLDAYHLQRSGSPGRGFAHVPAEQIFAFQYSDCSAKPVTGVKRPMDRLLPGLGVVKWEAVLQLLAEKNFKGYLSYEAPNPIYWEGDPVETARNAVAASRAVLSRAFGAQTSRKSSSV